jgi:hypothetical protein
MPVSRTLQLSPAEAGTAPTPQQKRFNTLVRQIERARLSLVAWQEGIAAYRQAYQKEVEPLHDSVFTTKRKWAFTLDALSDRPGWSRAESALLGELVCRIAGDLLREMLPENEDDQALQALFIRHNGTDFATQQQRQLQATLEMMRDVTGVELGDTAGIRDEDDLAELLHRKMREDQAAEAARQAAKSARQRKSPARKKREAEAQQATQSVREIFRKLASALHPDREADPARREAKTALMQRANQAYAANDLLALLQLQLEIAQVDAARIADAGEEKLRYYNKALAEQLGQLKEELVRLETGFRLDAGMPPGVMVNPARLGDLIKQIKRELREYLAQLQQEVRLLADPAAAKRWLKRYRRAA